MLVERGGGEFQGIKAPEKIKRKARNQSSVDLI